MIFYTVYHFFFGFLTCHISKCCILLELSFLNFLLLHLRLKFWSQKYRISFNICFLKTSIAFLADPYSECKDLKALWNLWNRVLRWLCELFQIFHHSPKWVFFADVSELTLGSQMLLRVTRKSPRKHLKDAF